MKKVLAFILAIMPLCAMAQNYNEDGGKYEVYCDVKNITPNSDYGVYSIYVFDKRYVIVDKTGKEVDINKDSDVLTLLAKRGWRLVSSYFTNNDRVHYIMKKEVTKDSEAEEGLKQHKK